MEDICIKCNKERHRIDAFNLCHNCYMSQYRKKRRLMGTVPEKEREKQRINFRKWYSKNKEKHLANCKEYTKKHKKKHNIRMKTNQDKNSLPKTTCSECNSNKNIENHHLSYQNSDKIKILCRDCHRKMHRLCEIK